MRAVVLSGGLTHDFPATTARLTELLGELGFHCEVHTDVDDALEALPDAGLFVVNALRWTMTGPGTPERYRGLAAAEGASPAPRARAALAEHLRGGGGVLGMHTASICFDDWPQWGAALGAAWRWGRSSHPPLCRVRVRIADGAHPLVTGLGDFTIDDEVYGFLDTSPDVVPLLVGEHSGTEHPLLWVREHGGGRVVYDALGHHPPSYAVPEHREIIRRAVAWAAGT